MDNNHQILKNGDAVSSAFLKKFQLPQRLRGSTQSVWWVMCFDCESQPTILVFRCILCLFNRNEYTALGIKYQPLSLAHGFPDFLGPKYITDALISSVGNPDYMLNQYTRGFVNYFTVYSSVSNTINKCDFFVGTSTFGSSIVGTLFEIDWSENWSVQWNFGYIWCLWSALHGRSRVCIAFLMMFASCECRYFLLNAFFLHELLQSGI